MPATIEIAAEAWDPAVAQLVAWLAAQGGAAAPPELLRQVAVDALGRWLDELVHSCLAELRECGAVLPERPFRFQLLRDQLRSAAAWAAACGCSPWAPPAAALVAVDPEADGPR